MRREVVRQGDGVALAELLAGDRELLLAAVDPESRVDPDDRPRRTAGSELRQVAVIDGGGELIGQASWLAVGYGPTAACEAWNLGLLLLPSARGSGTGTTVLRMLVDHLFATTDVDRLEGGTQPGNVAARRILAKVGFRAEGIIRGAQPRGGERGDQLLYGLLRSDLTPAGRRRVVVAERDGVGLALPLAGDRASVFDRCSSEFDLDADRRPSPLPPIPVTWLTIMDTRRGVPVGGVSYHAEGYGGTVGCAAWNLGVGLLPEERGRGFGWLAQRLLAEHLFASTELDRVEAATDVDNQAEQRALEKAGFLREGVIRGAQLRGGRRRDIVGYGILRSDLG